MKRILVVVGLSTLLLAGAILLVFDHEERAVRELYSEFQEHQFAHAKHLAHAIERFLWGHANGLRTVDYAIVSDFSPTELTQFLRSHLEQGEQFYAAEMSLYDRDGRRLGSTAELPLGFDLSKSELFARMREESGRGKVVVSRIRPGEVVPTPQSTGSSSPLEFLLCLPRHGEGPQGGTRPGEKGFAGVIALRLNLGEFLFDHLNTIDLELKLHQLWILEEDGTLLFQSAHPEMEGRNIYQQDQTCSGCHVSFDHAAEILSQSRGTVDYQIRDRPKKLAAYSRMEFGGLGWIVVISSEYDQVVASARRNTAEHLAMLGLIVLSLLGGSTFMYRGYRSQVRADEEARQWREKRALQERVARAEARYRTIVDTAHDAIWTVDANGRFTFMNGRAEELTGCTASEWIGSDCTPMLDPGDLVAARDVFPRVLRGEKVGFEARVLSRTGQVRDLSVISVPLYEGAKIVGAVGFGRDITEQKRASEALRLERDKLEMVTRNIGAGLAIVSSEYRVLWANEVMNDVFGEIVGLPCYEKMSARTEPCEECGVRALVESGGENIVREQIKIDKEGREAWFQIIVTPIRDEGGRITAALELFVPITQLKQAESALQLERDKLKGILDAMPNAVYMVGENHEILYTNPALEKEFGLVAGRKCYEYFHGRTEPCPLCKNPEVFAGESVHWEWSSPQGRIYDLFDTRVAGEDGRWVKLEIFHDVTERKRAEEEVRKLNQELEQRVLERTAQWEMANRELASEIVERKRTFDLLEASEERYRSLVHTATDAVILMDATGRVLEWNRAAERLFGYSAEEAKDRAFTRVLPRAMSSLFEEGGDGDIFRRVAHLLGETVETVGRRKDGSEFPAEISLAHGTAREATFFTAIVRDISWRKEVEKEIRGHRDRLEELVAQRTMALAESEERYRTLVETMGEGLSMIDDNDRILYVNESYCRLLGYSREEMIGRRLTEFAEGEDRTILENQLKKRREGVRASYEITWSRKDGRRVAAIVSPVPLFDETGRYKGSIGVNTDITDRKKMEGALRDSENRLKVVSLQLLDAQEEERRRISRELHDELGQALTAMKYRLRFMEKHLREDQPDIRRECQEGLQHVDQTLEEVRRLSRDLSPSVLEDLGLLSAIRSLLKTTGIPHEMDVSPDSQDVDSVLPAKTQIVVYRMLQEALTNVFRHANASRVELRIRNTGASLVIEAEDDGKGFDVERVLKNPGARGLGLVSMQERARMLGGALRIVSQEGRGTCVTLTLPAAERGGA
jgi:PAS domain S-box-containing protein